MDEIWNSVGCELIYKEHMSESVEVLKFKQNLNQNKDRFKSQIQYICDLFSVDGSNYIRKYDDIGGEMVNTFIQFNELQKRLNELDYQCEKLKNEIIIDNNIDLKEKLKGLKNREKVLDELFRLGFVNSDMWEILKEFFWNDRGNRMTYEFPKWK